MTANKLDEIIAHKKHEISVVYKNFKRALQMDGLSIIGEIKRRSPSKGHFADIHDPVLLAEDYIKAGVNAISVLTDQKFFSGSFDDLEKIATHSQSTPVLCKDFIIDKRQINTAAKAGADAVLLIVAVLGHKTKEFIDYTKSLNIEALVEVFNKDELDIALESNAKIIAVNNRNLKTFEVDTENAIRLIDFMPQHIIKVAASGILKPELARRYYKAGFDAVLIGEALVTSPSPAEFIRACRHE